MQELPKSFFGKDKKLRSDLKQNEFKKKKAQKSLNMHSFFYKESAGYLEPEENEQTVKFRQQDIKDLLPLQNTYNVFDLELEFGNYYIDYTVNGKNLLMCSNKGHIALMEWQKKKLITEFHVKEKTYDACFLQNESCYAVAQKKYIYLYDAQGLELQRLKSHIQPSFLEFLPYHLLLVSLSQTGVLRYLDITTGHLASEYKTSVPFQSFTTLRQNPQNAIILAGDNKGNLSMFSPNSKNPLIKIQAHKTSLLDTAAFGNYLVTSGAENIVKVWDLRNYKEQFSYYSEKQPSKISISQKGLLAVSNVKRVDIWKDWFVEKQKRPYLKQETSQNKVITDLKFVNFEDFLGIGLESVPGAGEPNFDSFEVNVFETKKQRKEALVHSLLNKLPASTIMLNPNIIGTVDTANQEVIQAEKKAEENEINEKKIKNQKKKTRGKQKIAKKLKLKESVHDEATLSKLKQFSQNKLKIKLAEKRKREEQLKLANSLDELVEFNPLSALKKKKVKLDEN